MSQLEIQDWRISSDQQRGQKYRNNTCRENIILDNIKSKDHSWLNSWHYGFLFQKISTSLLQKVFSMNPLTRLELSVYEPQLILLAHALRSKQGCQNKPATGAFHTSGYFEWAIPENIHTQPRTASMF